MNAQQTLVYLKEKAAFHRSIREFFAARHVLEVETPVLWPTTLPDPNVPSIEAYYRPDPNRPAKRQYLQTSPEFFMKRLLAFGSGSIFQLAKAFRNDAEGKLHRPEFTLLEWYRVGFDHFALMDEVDVFLQAMLATPSAEKITYQSLFLTHLSIDPLLATKADLMACAKAKKLALSDTWAAENKDTWLDLLMSHCIEPTLGFDKPCIIYHYPISQAALARVNPDDPQTACRFEVYYRGVELANGFYELADSVIQRRRFMAYQRESVHRGLPPYDLDEDFLASIDQLPDCAGVALGVDRLFVLKYHLTVIPDIFSTPSAGVCSE